MPADPPTRRGDRTRKNGSHWGERLIRPGGRVKWHGRWYVLDDSPANVSPEEYEAMPQRHSARSMDLCPRYDGRMDGRRGLFYDYGPDPYGNGSEGPLTQAVWLHNVDDEWPGPACVGGMFVWERFSLAEAPR